MTEVASQSTRPRPFRFTLRGLLLMVTFACLATALVCMYRELTQVKRQLAQAEFERAQRALIAITEKGVDAKLADLDNTVIIFKNGNVSDYDLAVFVPAFDKSSRIPGFGRITELQLRGSNVTDEALDRFKRRVPWCKVVR